MSANASPPGPRAGRREWIGLAVLALPTLLASIDLTVLYLALPHLSADLGATTNQQLWIVDVFGFMVAGFLVTMGTLGDRIGNRKLLMIGAAGFSGISVLAAYAPNPELLIAARALMGIAGAAGMPATLALITHMFKDPTQRGMAIAAWMSCFMGGLVLGPVVGGVMLQYFWWGSVFLLGVPIMLLLMATAPALLPEHRNPDAGRLDPFSVALSLLAILPAIYGLQQMARHGVHPELVVSLVVGLGFGVWFVLRQRRLSNPLLDLRLFAIRTLRAALVLGLLVGALNGGMSLQVTQYLQVIQGLSPLRAGLWLLAPSIAMIFGLFLAPGLCAKLRPGYVVATGIAIAAVGYVILSQVPSTGGLTTLVVGFAVLMFGMGLPLSLVTGLIVGSAPPEKAGSASALQQSGNEFGIALGIAVLGSIAMAVYRSHLASDAPSGVPASAVAAVRDNVAIAGRTPGMLGPAREAFTAGLTTVAAISAVVMVALAVLAAVTLRHVSPNAIPRPGAQPGAAPAEPVEQPA